METTVFKMGSETSNHFHEIDFLISTGDKIFRWKLNLETIEIINRWTIFVQNLVAA